MTTDDLIGFAYEREDWTKAAACKGMSADAFFPSRGEETRTIKAICHGCPVIDDCLDYALRTGQKFDIWGGKSERERRHLRRVNGNGPAVDIARYQRAADIAIAAHRAGQVPSVAVSDALGVTVETARGILSRARGLGIEIPALHNGGNGSRLSA